MKLDRSARRSQMGYFFSGCLLLCATNALAIASPSPIGIWQIRSSSHQPQALISIKKTPSGLLIGRVLAIFTPSHQTIQTHCLHCSQSTFDPKTHNGFVQGAPLLGGVIMWGYRQQGASWHLGHIVDADSGHLYRSSLWLASTQKGGSDDVLYVTGQVLWVSRAQQWLRVSPAHYAQLCQHGLPNYQISCLNEAKRS